MEESPQLRSNYCKHRLMIIKVEEMTHAHGKRQTWRCLRCGAVIREFKRVENM